jgi:hypothetical protein
MTAKRIAGWHGRIAELALGHTLNWLTVYAFDFVLYPFVIWKLGLWRGGAVMAAASLVVCLLTLWFYDWSKRDWLGIEAVKLLRDGEGRTRFRRVLAWALARGDWIAFVALSVKFDPFITTVYLRRGASHGMTRRDWRVFLLSWLIGNAAWTFVCFGGVSLLRRWWP